MRELPIERPRVDLSIGDTVRIGNQLLTILDIVGDDVTFRIDSPVDLELGETEIQASVAGDFSCQRNSAKRFLPR